MIALVVLHASSPLLALGLAVTIAAALLVAHWGAFRPQVKKMVTVSLLLATLMALVAPAVRAEEEAGDGEFVIRNTCSDYEPWSLMWIVKGCMLPRRRRLVRRRR